MSGGQIVQALNRWAGVLAALAVLGNLVTGFALAQGWQANAPAARLAKLEAFADSSRADRTAPGERLAKLEALADALRADLNSLLRENDRRKATDEATARFLCLLDYRKATLASFPCRDLGVAP